MAEFDTAAAKAAGYSDADIAKVTSGIAAAKAAGYGDDEIAQQLQSFQPATTVGGALSEINKGIGRGVLLPAVQMGQALANSTQNVTSPLKMQPDESVTAFRQRVLNSLKATPSNNTEKMLGTGAELTASMLPYSGGPGTLAEKAVGLAIPVLGGVAGEQLGGEQGKMMGTMLAPAASAIVGRAFSPSITPELKSLTEAGAEPTVGQITGGFAKKFENYPLVKEITGPARGRATESFNTAVTNIALKPLQQYNPEAVIPRGMTGTEAFARADRLASQAYDDLLPKLTVKYDPAFSAEMAAQKAAAPAAVRADLEDLFNRVIINKLPQGNATIDPRLMKEMDTELGQQARRYSRDPAVNSQNMADGIRNIQGAFRDMVSRQNPDLAPQLQAINSTWNNLLRVGNAVGRASATNGVFNPTQFQKAVQAMDASLRKKAFQTGNAAMQGAATAGINVLGPGEQPHVPWGAFRSLGTAAGAAGAGVAGASALGVGSTIGAPIAAAAAGYGSMYTPWGQRIMNSVLTGSRPAALQTLGTTLRNAPPTALGAIPLFTRGEQ